MTAPAMVLFSNPKLEERFRELARVENEIGGWLITRHEPHNWPGRFSWQQFKQGMVPGEGWPHFIDHIVLVPNEARQKKTTYTAWDMEKAQEVVQATASLYDGTPIHFHSHPNNNHLPSHADIAFAGHYCQQWPGYATFCIVTPDPLRLWPYAVEYGNAASPDRYDVLQGGSFLSWRSKRMRQFRP